MFNKKGRYLNGSLAFLLILALLDSFLFRRGLNSTVVTSDEIVGYKGIPGRIIGDEIKNRLNNLGYNDEDVDLEMMRKKNPQNILFVGDSILMATQVDRNLNFVSLLRRQISNRESNGNQKQYEPTKLNNFGVIGFDYRQSYYNYLKYKEILKPEYVFYVFCVNDFLTKDEHKEFVDDVKEKLFMYSAGSGILNYLRKFFENHQLRPYWPENRHDLWYSEKSKSSPPEEQLLDFIEVMKSYHELTSGRFAVLLLPPRQVVFENLESPFLEKVLPLRLQQAGIQSFSATQYLKSSYLKTHAELYGDPVHLSHLGHRLVADFLKPIVDNLNFAKNKK